ncbi:hypothetical protein AB0A63_13825 [Lentzea sp. NPDC042327]|uniref:hypothetical protein n=1 Tax=Lentzea sp. NPDC042327 TaxID=3154801 RepID=UPI0033EEB7F6
MSLTSTSRRAAPRWITPYDACRSYLLPDTVETNIGHRGHGADCGAHNWARGLLVELHRLLGGVPLSTHYSELTTRHPDDHDAGPAALPIGFEVTARLARRNNEVVEVVSRIENAPHGPRGDHWQVTVNGEIPADDDPRLHGVHRYPPSLPLLALIVHHHLRGQSAQSP